MPRVPDCARKRESVRVVCLVSHLVLAAPGAARVIEKRVARMARVAAADVRFKYQVTG